MDDTAPQGDVYQIPDEAIARWVALPADQPLSMPITKNDIDNLFFAIRNLGYSVANLHGAVVQSGLGNAGNAAKLYDDASGQYLDSINRIGRFMTAMMEKADLRE